MFEQVCIIGLGLIGASFAQAIRDRNLALRIVAVDSHSSSIEAAIDEAVIDAGSRCLKDVVAGSDCIIIAVPVKAVAAVFDEIHAAMQLGLMSKHCLLSDVCSTKKNVVQAAKKSFIRLPSGLVPAHPIAGAEHSGFHARRSHLFVNHNVIICELASTDKAAINCITTLWEAVGATVMTMDIDHHDAVLAYTSHLPHLLAFNLVDQLASHDDNMDIFRYAAGGFRDFTRIAASDPVMWHDIFIANKTSLLKALDEYSSYLSNLRGMIDSEDSTQLLGLLGRAQSARQHFGHMLTGTPYTKQLSSPPRSDNVDASSLVALSTFTVTPSSRLQGNMAIAGDALISQLSIMLASLAQGITNISGVFEGEDSLATLQAFRDMGVTIEGPDNGDVVIHGAGMQGLKPSHTPFYMGHSDTSMRLLSGLLVGQSFDSVLTADAHLSNTPMERVATPLRKMGAIIQTTGAKGTAPISIKGHNALNQPLHGISYERPMVSKAQVKSCLLLAGLYAKGETTVIEPASTLEHCDHTERMLSAFGYEVRVAGNTSSVTGGGQLTACNIKVPADISCAAFFIVAASIAMDSELTMSHVGVNPNRTAVIDILRLMGANITLSQNTSVGGEPVADIKVKSAALKGVVIPESLINQAIDELPILMIAASCAVGSTTLSGANELSVKVSDCLDAMTEGLITLGIRCTLTAHSLIIEGRGSENADSKNNVRAINTNAVFNGGEIRSYDDHRIAISFSVAGVRASDIIIIKGIETVRTKFPNFEGLSNAIGMNITIHPS